MGAKGDVKLQRDKLQLVDLPDDPAYPFKLRVAFIHQALHGTGLSLVLDHEDVRIYQGTTAEALLAFVEEQGFWKHRLFKSYTITNSTGRTMHQQVGRRTT